MSLAVPPVGTQLQAQNGTIRQRGDVQSKPNPQNIPLSLPVIPPQPITIQDLVKMVNFCDCSGLKMGVTCEALKAFADNHKDFTEMGMTAEAHKEYLDARDHVIAMIDRNKNTIGKDGGIDVATILRIKDAIHELDHTYNARAEPFTFDVPQVAHPPKTEAISTPPPPTMEVGNPLPSAVLSLPTATVAPSRAASLEAPRPTVTKPQPKSDSQPVVTLHETVSESVRVLTAPTTTGRTQPNHLSKLVVTLSESTAEPVRKTLIPSDPETTRAPLPELMPVTSDKRPQSMAHAENMGVIVLPVVPEKTMTKLGEMPAMTAAASAPASETIVVTLKSLGSFPKFELMVDMDLPEIFPRGSFPDTHSVSGPSSSKVMLEGKGGVLEIVPLQWDVTSPLMSVSPSASPTASLISEPPNAFSEQIQQLVQQFKSPIPPTVVQGLMHIAEPQIQTQVLHVLTPLVTVQDPVLCDKTLSVLEKVVVHPKETQLVVFQNLVQILNQKSEQKVPSIRLLESVVTTVAKTVPAQLPEVLEVLDSFKPTQTTVLLSHTLNWVSQKSPEVLQDMVQFFQDVKDTMPKELSKVALTVLSTIKEAEILLPKVVDFLTQTLAKDPPLFRQIMQVVTSAEKSGGEISALILTMQMIEQSTFLELAPIPSRNSSEAAISSFEITQQAPRQLEPALKLFQSITTTQPKSLESVARALAVMAKFAPDHVETAVKLFSTVLEKAPEALPKVAASLSEIAQQAPRQLEPALKLFQSITTTQPKSLESVARALAVMAKFAPEHVETAIKLFSTVLEKAPEALLRVAAALSEIAQQAPRQLEPALKLFQSITTTQPKSLDSVARTLAVMAKFAPEHVETAVKLFSTVLEKAPEALLKVAAALSEIAQQAPRQLEPALRLFQSITTTQPKALESVARALAVMTKFAPDHVETAVKLFSTVLEKAPEALPKVTTALANFSQKTPQLFKPILEIFQMVSRTHPELLLSLLDTLSQFSQSGSLTALHERILGLLNNVSRENQENLARLFQQLFNEGAYLLIYGEARVQLAAIDEIENLRKHSKLNIKRNKISQSFTDELILLFDRMEMEGWKTAALFRKKLESRK